jgi:O-antigen ligase
MSLCSSVSSKSTAAVYGRVRRVGSFLLPLVLVGGLAFDNGGFDATSWGWGTLLPLVVVGVAIVRGVVGPPPRFAFAFLGLLAAFTAWTWLSAVWSDDVARTVLDGERAFVYFAAATAFVLIDRTHVERFLFGLLAAISVVSAWSLCLRVFGGAGSYDVASVSADARQRLAAPLGYSNGLGVFAAIGVVLALGLALRLRRPLAAAPLLVLVPTLYFTYSRGAWLALAAGVVAAVIVARPRVPRRLAFAAGVVAAAALVVGLVRVGGPGGAVRKFSHAGPAVKADQNRRLFSLSGSSRAQYWHVAWRQYEANPWLGSGAGSFQRHWLRERPAALPVLDAHSLYLETLAELGPLGLALLAGLLTVPLAAAVAARANALAAPAAGGYVAFLAHAAQDWDWELPAVTLVGLGCAAALLTLAGRRSTIALRAPVRAAAVAVVVLLGIAALGALAGNHALASTNAALDADEPVQAARHARWAERLVPWSPTPWRLHGEALLSQGDVEGAERDFRRAVEKDPADWESWADLALVGKGEDARAAAAEANRLNPLEQVQPGEG